MASYACHNRPRPTADTSYPAQDGWEYREKDGMWNTTRYPRIIHIDHAMSTDCRYDGSDTDPRCSGCQHAAVDARFDPDSTTDNKNHEHIPQ